MSGLMTWVKSNWLVVVLALVTVVSLPTMLVMGHRMSSNLRDEVQREVTSDVQELRQGERLRYTIPAIGPAMQQVEHTAPPNEALIRFFREQRDALQSEAERVVEKAIEFNRRGHGSLVESLFPAPPEGDEIILPIEFGRQYTEVAHQRLLERAGAGTPPDSERLVGRVQDYRETALQRLQAESRSRELDEQAQKRLEEELRQLRIGRYRQRAAEIRFYADRYVFARVPETRPSQPPNLVECYDWQWQYWIHTDVIDAVRLANEEGGSGGVPESVVKRVVSISARQMGTGEELDRGRQRGAGRAAPPGVEVRAPTVTGRLSNEDYDVRVVDVELIVSARRLPVLFDALSRTNFMTVIDLDLERVDPVEELRRGFYYGEEEVLRARMAIETVWLRAWTADLMPRRIREAYGVPDDPPDRGPGGG